MRFSFNYPCRIGVVLPDGDMTTLMFGCGEVVFPVNAGCLTMEARTHQDFELEDGTLLVNVPLSAITWEADDAHCV